MTDDAQIRDSKILTDPETLVETLIRLQNRTSYRFGVVILIVTIMLFACTTSLFWVKSTNDVAYMASELAEMRADLRAIKESLKVGGVIVGIRAIQVGGALDPDRQDGHKLSTVKLGKK